MAAGSLPRNPPRMPGPQISSCTTEPDQPVSVMVTYWGGDTDIRTFDIPADLTKGKQKVIVKFQAHPGAVAGGVYGCRAMKSGM